ncbi:MAG: tetratricopeptide repeat protein, partial [Bacteroidota bacterium]
PNFISSAHTNLGLAMKKNGNLNMALDHYFTALRIDTTAGLEMDAAITLSNIGGVLFALQRYDEALEYFSRAYQKMETHDMTSQMEITLGNIASVYKNLGELEKALSYHKEALALAEMLDKKISIGIKNLNIGNIYTLMDQPDNALEYFEKALPLFISSGSKFEIANTYLHIAKANQQKKRFRQARIDGEVAYQKADSIEAVALLKDAAKLLSEVYYSLGNLDKALDYRRRYDTYKDSLYTEETSRLLAEMDARFNLSEQAHKIDLLRKEQLIKNRTLKQQRHTIILLATGGFILISLILIIWIQYRQKQRSYKNLMRKNHELVKAERAARKRELEKLENKSEQVITGEENILAGLLKLLDEQKVYLKQQISQKEMAEILETNTSYLSRIINKHFNLTFSNLINKYRVEEVQRLLSTEDSRLLTIEAIARECGFHSKSAFQSAFKKFTGMTPSAYLREVRRNDNEQLKD